MSDEDGFLAVIRQTPADDLARLVYADWLDDCDDALSNQKAAFIRLELRIANEPADDYASLFVQLQKLAEQLDPDWLVLVSRPRIEGCETRTGRECPSIWSRLAPTADPHIRNCGECRRPVHYCHSLVHARNRGWGRERTVVTLAVIRRTDGLDWEALSQAEIDRLLRERAQQQPSKSDGESELERLRAEANRDEAAACDALPSEREGRPAPRARRQKGRHRNLQRDNWEDAD